MLENLTLRLLETTSLLATCLLELPQQLPPHGERRTGRNCSTTRALASPSPRPAPAAVKMSAIHIILSQKWEKYN